jgi:hypothetical protein
MADYEINKINDCMNQYKCMCSLFCFIFVSILSPIMVNWTPPSFLPKEGVHNTIRRMYILLPYHDFNMEMLQILAFNDEILGRMECGVPEFVETNIKQNSEHIHCPIWFKSYPRVSQILLSCTSPGVRSYISSNPI